MSRDHFWRTAGRENWRRRWRRRLCHRPVRVTYTAGWRAPRQPAGDVRRVLTTNWPLTDQTDQAFAAEDSRRGASRRPEGTLTLTDSGRLTHNVSDVVSETGNYKVDQ